MLDRGNVRPFAGTLVIHELQLGLYWAWSSASLQALHPFRSSTVASGSAAVTSIAPLLKAIKTKGLCLQASLGEVEISISDLVALRPGDVVRFPASITSGIRLAIEAGSGNQDAVIAQLGQMDGYTAVRVSSLHTAS
jgi:flagellar motor switch protein FliM